MKDKFQKLKNAVETKPKYLVNQKVIFPIYSFDLSGEFDVNAFTEKLLPLKESKDKNHKPEVVVDGYQTKTFQSTGMVDCVQEINTIIENKSKLVFDQNYKIKDSWLVFYDEGTEVLPHHHYSLKSFYEGSKQFLIYPISFAYYPLCTKKSSPIIFSNLDGNDLVIPIEQNTLLIFNSHLMHFVPKSTDDKLRIVYSGNLFVNGFKG